MRAHKEMDDDEWQAGEEDYDDEYEQSVQHKPRYAKKRTLNRWNVDQDQYILLALVEVCAFQGLELPWAQVGEHCDPVLSEQSIKQHLAKTRIVRERSGFPCPPRLERPRVVSKKTANRRAAGAGLLPPPEQNRKGKKRGNSSIEPVEVPKKRARASTAPEVKEPQPTGPIDQLSGFQVGSEQHGDFLCKQAASFNNSTSSYPQSVDFMGTSYAFEFNPKRYEGPTADLHQAMVYEAADRLIQAGRYPGDEQIRAAAKKAGLGGDAQDRFKMKQLQYPVPYELPRAKIVTREQSALPKLEAPVAPMYAAQTAPASGPQSAMPQSSMLLNASLPRSLTWPSLTYAPVAVADYGHQAKSAPASQLSWSPAEAQYVAASQPAGLAGEADSLPAFSQPKVEPNYFLCSGMNGLVTPPSDSLNASQLVKPIISTQISQDLTVDCGPSLDHVKVDGNGDVQDNFIPTSYNLDSPYVGHQADVSQLLNGDPDFSDLIHFADGGRNFEEGPTAHNPCDTQTW